MLSPSSFRLDPAVPESSPHNTAVVAEYERLYPWERRQAIKRFRYHLAQGTRVHPDKPEVVWDRAVFLGYRGALQAWMWVGFPGGLAGFPLGLLPRVVGIVGLGIALMLIAWTTSMLFVRIVQARRLHPRWRGYKLSANDGNWD